MRDAVNDGVQLGFACGANMAVPDRWRQLAGAQWDGPWLLMDLDRAEIPPEQRLGFRLAVYLSVLTEDDRERLRVQYDTVCQTFGWLYAVDAATMPFDLFASRIREWNYFPARLAWDATCTFVTPEEPPRGFDFWNRPEQFKRVLRVYAVDGVPVLVDGFTSLPLVDGPYLTADGHSGRIEIRAPRQPPEDRLPGPRPPRRRGPGAHRQRDVAPAGHRPRAGRRSASLSGGPRPPRMRRAAGGGRRDAGGGLRHGHVGQVAQRIVEVLGRERRERDVFA